MKAALVSFPGRYTLPGKPTSVSRQAADAYKQTQFLLTDELALFERSMNLQLSIVAANSKTRTAAATALFSLWSRAFSNFADACTLMCGGSYISCPPLLRSALDSIAVQRSLATSGFAEYEEWLEGAASQAKEHQALAFDLGRYRAASVLAEDESLGTIYRFLTDLSMPHFGSTALQTGPDSGLQKLAIAFGDTTFHLGWAQLISGWLLALASAQTEAIESSGVIALATDNRSEADALSAATRRLLSDSRRCRVEEWEGRFLLHNYRRTASGQPKRVML